MEDRRRLPLRYTRVVMTFALLIGVIGLGAVYASSANAFACDVYTPSGGATTGDWSVAANWSAGIPTSNTEACWASNVTVTVSSGSQTAEGIVGNGTAASGPLDIDGGTLTLGTSSSDDSSAASLAMSGGGTLDGSGTLAVNGAFTLTGGNIGASGRPAITSESFSVSNPDTISSDFDAGSISVDGPVSIGTPYFSSPNSGVASLTDTSSTYPTTFTPGAYGEDDGYMTMTSADGYSISGNTDPLNYRLTQTGGTTVIPAGDFFYPGDTFQLQGGTLQDDGAIGTGVNVTGGTLDGKGSSDATVSNPSGTVAPGDPGTMGTLTVPSYIQGADGTLTISVDGTLSGQFSILHDNGPAQLAGTLALEPDGTFANSATPGEEVDFLPYTNSLTGTFGTTTVSRPLPNNETFSALYDTGGSQVDAIVGQQAPVNTGRPVISGQTAPGDVLTCAPGTWTGSPAFTYIWDRDGSPIAGATSHTYTLTTADQGHTLTCVVTGTNYGGHASATSAGVAIPTAVTTTTPIVAPAPSGGAAVHGTALPGDRLTCDPGTWTGDPTFTYQWIRGRSPITGATTGTHTVTILDEGTTITCVITGHNSAGTNSTTAPGVVVAQKGTLRCPKPTGTLSPGKVGPLKLGETRTAARRALKKYGITHYGFDNFCLFGGWGIRGAYKSNKFVLLLTANPYYKLASVSVGLKITSIAKRLKPGKVFVIGLNDWYVAPGTTSNYVFKVRHGVIQEIGIANKRDTTGRAKQRKFLSGFKAV